MRFSSFKYDEGIVTSEKKIQKILLENNLPWLLEAEIDSADVEVKNSTLIWNSGTWYWGNWHFGIWKSGDWYDGIWENGIWENGNFINGEFRSGIMEEGTIKGRDVNIKNN